MLLLCPDLVSFFPPFKQCPSILNLVLRLEKKALERLSLGDTNTRCSRVVVLDDLKSLVVFLLHGIIHHLQLAHSVSPPPGSIHSSDSCTIQAWSALGASRKA